MGIKWNDVKLGCSILSNIIYIGKVKRDKDGMQLWTDKSGDKTDECVKAVMEHMMTTCKEQNKNTTAYEIKGVCELRITDLRE